MAGVVDAAWPERSATVGGRGGYLRGHVRGAGQDGRAPGGRGHPRWAVRSATWPWPPSRPSVRFHVALSAPGGTAPPGARLRRGPGPAAPCPTTSERAVGRRRALTPARRRPTGPGRDHARTSAPTTATARTTTHDHRSHRHRQRHQLNIHNDTNHSPSRPHKQHQQATNIDKTQHQHCPVRAEMARPPAADLRFANRVGRPGPAVVQLYLAHSVRVDHGRSIATSDSSHFVRSQTPPRQESGQPRHCPRQLIRTSPLQPGQDKHHTNTYKITRLEPEPCTYALSNDLGR